MGSGFSILPGFFGGCPGGTKKDVDVVYEYGLVLPRLMYLVLRAVAVALAFVKDGSSPRQDAVELPTACSSNRNAAAAPGMVLRLTSPCYVLNCSDESISVRSGSLKLNRTPMKFKEVAE